MRQAKTLFLNRAQLYTVKGAVRSPKVLPEADDHRNNKKCVLRIIPRGTKFPLRRCAAIPIKEGGAPYAMS